MLHLRVLGDEGGGDDLLAEIEDGSETELGTIAYGENEEEVFLGRSVTR